MYYYHFQAKGYRQGAGEFCSDAAAAERIAFEIFLEMSACAKRVVIVTVRNSEGATVFRVPRLSESDFADLSAPSVS